MMTVLCLKRLSDKFRPRDVYMNYSMKDAMITKQRYSQNLLLNQLAETLLKKWMTKLQIKSQVFLNYAKS